MNRRSASSHEPLTAGEEAFMRAFAVAFVTIPRALDDDMVKEQGMSMTDYFALMHLSESPERRLRMGDLAAAAALSLSGMSRIVQRLEGDGLVRREKSNTDGRGWHAVLTDEGLQRLQEAWPSHVASVRRRIFDRLSPTELPALTAGLQSLVDIEGQAGGGSQRPPS